MNAQLFPIKIIIVFIFLKIIEQFLARKYVHVFVRPPVAWKIQVLKWSTFFEWDTNLNL